MANWCNGIKQTRVFIGPDTSAVGGAKGCILSLRHPRSGKRTCYISKNGSLQELHWFKQPYGSWFLGDYVTEDGGLYISTPVDPVFLLLPLFVEARMKTGNDHGMFRELSEILYVDGYPGYQHLLPFAENYMKLLCELKEMGTSRFFRLDNLKVLSWLCHKVNNLKAALSKLDKNFAAQGESDTLIDALLILGEYLMDDPWLKLLCSHYQLNLEDAVRKLPTEGSVMTLEETPQPHSIAPPMKNGNGGSASSMSKQSKKLKTQVNSKNIKDMFRRVTRSSGT